MDICVIGTGYVGLVVGTCLAEMGNNVICVDKDKEKLNSIIKGNMPIYEPGLEDLIETNLGENRLFFSSDIKDTVKNSQICFIAVGTPQDENGNADLTEIIDVAKEIGSSINGYKIIVDKSTVPVGTAEKIAQIIKEQTKEDFDIVSNPEFLKQGAAVDDFLKPDRIIIGSDSPKATEIMQNLYAPFVRTGNPIILMDVKSAEMTKYAANAFLALKISYANEIANICGKVGANIEFVRKGMCSDHRIGCKFLFPGLGYGGSCFPKDIKALINLADENNYEAKLLKATEEINKRQKDIFINKITTRFGEDLSGKHFCVWGLTFKPKTNDIREAPSIEIIQKLLKKGASITAFDPKGIETAKQVLGNTIKYAKSSFSALKNADALIISTEWNEFRNPDFGKIKQSLKSPIIFDGRNQYNPEQLTKIGFEYHYFGEIKDKP